MRPIATISAVTYTGGKVTGIPALNVLAENIPVAVGIGYVTPHPPTPYPITHSMGFTIPSSKSVLINNLPPLRFMDKVNCGCSVTLGAGKPSVICG